MTQIEWTHRPGTKGETWNPIVGCSIVSPGCTNCYAMTFAGNRLDRDGGPAHYRGTTMPTKAGPVWTGKVALASERTLTAPLRATTPRTYFVNSMGDLFHEDVPDDWIDRVFAVMALCPQHTFIVLTKRSARMREFMSNLHKAVRVMQARLRASSDEIACIEQAQRFAVRKGERTNDLVVEFPHFSGSFAHPQFEWKTSWPLPNVWLGVSAERHQEADERIPDLLATPAAVRFMSAEPLLGPIELRPYWLRSQTFSKMWLDWIIVGGESGPNARPMHPEWVRSIRDQCTAAGVPFFFKQWGQWAPNSNCNIYGRSIDGKWDHGDARDIHDWPGSAEDFSLKVGKARAGRLLDGVEHIAWPEVQ